MDNIAWLAWEFVVCCHHSFFKQRMLHNTVIMTDTKTNCIGHVHTCLFAHKIWRHFVGFLQLEVSLRLCEIGRWMIDNNFCTQFKSIPARLNIISVELLLVDGESIRIREAPNCAIINRCKYIERSLQWLDDRNHHHMRYLKNHIIIVTCVQSNLEWTLIYSCDLFVCLSGWLAIWPYDYSTKWAFDHLTNIIKTTAKQIQTNIWPRMFTLCYWQR